MSGVHAVSDPLPPVWMRMPQAPCDGPVRGELLAFARDPAAPLTRAFCAAIARFHCYAGTLTPPLDATRAEFHAALDYFLPGVLARFTLGEAGAGPVPGTDFDADEYVDLLALLADHRADPGPETTWLARSIALCCMGEQHLWEDMGLADREALSMLIAGGFPSLAAKNTNDMRWKKFFYKQLCEREGLNLCRAPVCTECSDYAQCFGPETPGSEGWRRRAHS